MLLISCLSSCVLMVCAEDTVDGDFFSELSFINVVVSVEKFTVNGEYVVEPTLIRVPEGANAAEATIMLLDQVFPDLLDGQKPYRYTGTLGGGNFYLQSIWDPRLTHETLENGR